MDARSFEGRASIANSTSRSRSSPGPPWASRRSVSAQAHLAATLAAVGASGWIDALPDSVDTPVGSGGVGVTPRRTQQLALARVLLFDPEVVVLDEATAEGGSDTVQALDRAATGDVVVVVMDDARVIERERPDALQPTDGRSPRTPPRWSTRSWSRIYSMTTTSADPDLTSLPARPAHPSAGDTDKAETVVGGGGGRKQTAQSLLAGSGRRAVRPRQRPYRPCRPVGFVVSTASHSGRQTTGGNTAC